MMTELRRESQKHRDLTHASQREIAKLRRKEKNAVETTKRLEKSNGIQRAMLKRRNEEVIKSQSKLKAVMTLLKRSATPNRIFKTVQSGAISPVNPLTRIPSRQEDRIRRRPFSGPAVNELLASVNSPVRLTVGQSIADMNSSVEIRAQFKKQMVDKELDACILCRRTQRKLADLQSVRQKLVGEQQELIAERVRVVQATYEETRVYEADTPQYMDERVQVIDTEIADIDEKMVNLEELLKRKSGSMTRPSNNRGTPNSESNVIDLNWENALGLLKSLDRVELEAALSYFLEDLMSLRVEKEDKVSKEQENTCIISNLKRMVEVLRTAILQQQDQAEGLAVDPRERQRFQKEKLIIKREEHNEVPEIRRTEVADKSSPRLATLEMAMPKKSLHDMIFGSNKNEDYAGKKKLILGTEHIELPPIGSVLDMERQGISPVRTVPKKASSPSDENKFDREDRRMNMGGSDVFERLANAHTLASQAKVINRSAIPDLESLKEGDLV